MTRSTHLPSPSPEQIRALMNTYGWTVKEAAGMIGVTVRSMQQQLSGERNMTGGNWLLLRAWARMPREMGELV